MAANLTTATQRSTTIIDVSNGSTTSKSLSTSARPRISSQDVSDPDRLVRIIQDLQDQISRTTQASRTNPHSAPCIVRNQPAISGTVLIVRHTLGRALTGWWVCRAQVASFAGYELLPGAGGYPTGLDTTQVLVIMPSSSGLYDFCISAD